MAMEVSHIWIGSFGEEAPEDFFEEVYGEDDEPISKFAESQGEIWINHDWMEMSYLEEEENIKSLVTGHSFSESYLEQVVIDSQKMGIDKANVFILCDVNEITNPRTVENELFQLIYLGQYECIV